MRRATVLVTVLLGLAALASCGHAQECLALPCPMPMALTISVAGANGVAAADVTVQVSGGTATTMHCRATCAVPGYAGTYDLAISAPGFQVARRTVVVRGELPDRCSCGTTSTEHVDVVLLAIA